MFDLLIAAKLFLSAPQSILGSERDKIQARFGAPGSVATDFRPSTTDTAPPDEVVTLDWPQLRVRLYRSETTKVVSLIGVTATSDVLGIDSPIRVGTGRSLVLREFGAPLYEDDDQLVYALTQADPRSPNQSVRIVLREDRVVGFDWTYPLE